MPGLSPLQLVSLSACFGLLPHSGRAQADDPAGRPPRPLPVTAAGAPAAESELVPCRGAPGEEVRSAEASAVRGRACEPESRPIGAVPSPQPAMVLYVIGLGLGDEKDVTVRGLECIQSCKRVYLEHYTSILGIDAARLEAFYGRKVILADRNMVESEAEQIYLDALDNNIAFLVVGDPLCATTHTDLILRARGLKVPVEVIHNTSVMGAAASCGLQLYQFGYTVSIPLFEGTWRPSSFYERIKHNQAGKMHTLCLLDIKVKEPDYAAMIGGGGGGRGVRYLPPRFMSVNVAADQLLEVERSKGEGVVTGASLAVGMARLGQPTQKIVFGTLDQLRRVDFGPPLHCLALCGETHDLELEMLEFFRVKEEDLLDDEGTERLLRLGRGEPEEGEGSGSGSDSEPEQEAAPEA